MGSFPFTEISDRYFYLAYFIIIIIICVIFIFIIVFYVRSVQYANYHLRQALNARQGLVVGKQS